MQTSFFERIEFQKRLKPSSISSKPVKLSQSSLETKTTNNFRSKTQEATEFVSNPTRRRSKGGVNSNNASGGGEGSTAARFVRVLHHYFAAVIFNIATKYSVFAGTLLYRKDIYNN